MKQVGVRALKQNASALVAEAAAGEVVVITDHGRPVAQLVPVAASRIGALVAAGRARPPKRSLRDLPPPRPPAKEKQPLSAVLQDMRVGDRY